MFKRINGSLKDRRRRQRLAYFRREFARCGYPLGHLDNSELEALLTDGEYKIEEVPLSAKTIYFALRRLKQKSGMYLQPQKTEHGSHKDAKGIVTAE
jgi:hypothetical protein